MGQIVAKRVTTNNYNMLTSYKLDNPTQRGRQREREKENETEGWIEKKRGKGGWDENRVRM